MGGPLCSRNPHDKTVVVRRAHLRINQAALLGGNEQALRDYLSKTGRSQPSFLLAEAPR